ncbi:MAG: hypothetical protein GEU82_03360 [Luteitalea sp.]|nr:hypothetical protein [Luteitalea sp.]
MSFLELRAAVLSGALVLGAVCSASAQTVGSERPFRGLFGAPDVTGRGQTLAFDWSLLGAYDDNVVADSATAVDSRFAVNGMYGGASSALTYAAEREHMSFSVTGTSSGRYYPDVRELSAFDGGAGLAFRSDLGRRTKIDVAQSFAYQPYYGIDFMGSLAPSESATENAGGQSDQIGLQSRSSFGLDGQFGLERTLGARSSVRAHYGYRTMRFGGGEDRYSWRLANVAFSRKLTRDVAVRAGYGYGVGKNTVATAVPSVVNHNLDFGVDYNRQLSFSRRTRIHFSSGSTAVVDRATTDYRLIGTAGLTQEIGRSWRANAAYNRGLQYLPGFGEMFFADTVQLGVGGLVARRVEAGATGGWTAGQLGLERAADSYSSATAAANLRVAMSRTLSFFVQYTYYRYGFDAGAQMPFDLPPQLNRQAIRFGISGSLPLIGRRSVS